MYWSAVILHKPTDETVSLEGIVSKSEHIKGYGTVDQLGSMMPFDVTIRWGCTATSPVKRVINSASAIHKVYSKGQFRLELYHAGLSMPTAVNNFCGHYPCVLRPVHHSRGRDLFLCATPQEVVENMQGIEDDWYCSAYVEKTNEFRVYVVQGRVVQVIEKHPTDKSTVAWNCCPENGDGIYENIRWDDWPLDVVEKAVRAHNMSLLHWSVVDVMVSPMSVDVLEVNTSPQVDGPYAQGLLAKAFDWMLEYEDRNTLNVDPTAGWKGFIHPSISDKATGYE